MNLLSTLTLANASSVALALSDGTPVEFVKITSKDNIQVRVPTSHDLGDDPLRIFRRDGTHYKNDTDLTLVATAADAAAAPATAAVPAAAPAATASNDNTVYTVDGIDFTSLDEAKEEAISIFANDPSKTVTIEATVRKVIGVVGFTAIAA